jgi:trk system potassium uptake protein TrkA
MKIAVVGLGLFGKSLALQLARAGAEVIAIDARLDLVDDVKDAVSSAVKLDATDEKELRSQGIHQADVLVASIGDNFEANQLLVILAKKIGIRRVVARAPSETHARILGLVGADEVVLPEEQAAEDLSRKLVQPSLKGYFELIEGYSVAEILAPASFHGKRLADLELKTRYRVNLIAITRPGPDPQGRPSINAVPMGSDLIEKGDTLAVAGRDEDLKSLLDTAQG